MSNGSSHSRGNASNSDTRVEEEEADPSDLAIHDRQDPHSLNIPTSQPQKDLLSSTPKRDPLFIDLFDASVTFTALHDEQGAGFGTGAQVLANWDVVIDRRHPAIPWSRYRLPSIEDGFVAFMYQNKRIQLLTQQPFWANGLFYFFVQRPDWQERHVSGFILLLSCFVCLATSGALAVLCSPWCVHLTTKHTRARLAELQIVAGNVTYHAAALNHFGSIPGCAASNNQTERECAEDVPRVLVAGFGLMALIGPRFPLFVCLVAASVSCLVLGLFIVEREGSTTQPGLAFTFRIAFLRVFTTFIVQMAVMIGFRALREHLSRRAYETHLQVHAERQNAERSVAEVNGMLEHMLPPTVLPRLMKNEAPHDTEIASVLQSDICAFTAWCSTRTPMEAVHMLTMVVGELDALALEQRVVRIKTMGDGYLAVCGIPVAEEDHADRLFNFALGMQDTLLRLSTLHSEQWGILSMRIGMHSGEVTGAMLSRQRWAYDVFGSVPKGAASLEHNCPPGRILLSRDFQHSLVIIEPTLKPFSFQELGCPAVGCWIFTRRWSEQQEGEVEVDVEEELEMVASPQQGVHRTTTAALDRGSSSGASGASLKTTDQSTAANKFGCHYVAATVGTTTAQSDLEERPHLGESHSQIDGGGSTAGSAHNKQQQSGGSSSQLFFGPADLNLSSLSLKLGTITDSPAPSSFIIRGSPLSRPTIPRSESRSPVDFDSKDHPPPVQEVAPEHASPKLVEESGVRSEGHRNYVVWSDKAAAAVLFLNSWFQLATLTLLVPTEGFFANPAFIVHVVFAIVATANLLVTPADYLARTTATVIAVFAVPICLSLNPYLSNGAVSPAVLLMLPLAMTVIPYAFYFVSLGVILMAVVVSFVLIPQTVGTGVLFLAMMAGNGIAQVTQQVEWKAYRANLSDMLLLLDVIDSQAQLLEKLFFLKMPGHLLVPLLEQKANPQKEGGSTDSLVQVVPTAVVVFVQFIPTGNAPSLGAPVQLSQLALRLRALESQQLMVTTIDTLLPSLGGATPLIQKVKTIGDTVLIAGCLEPTEKTPQQVGADCLEFMRGLEKAVKMNFEQSCLAARAGVAVGPLVAAVIGKQQLEFDVFGTTVNKAARIMASLGTTSEFDISPPQEDSTDGPLLSPIGEADNGFIQEQDESTGSTTPVEGSATSSLVTFSLRVCDAFVHLMALADGGGANRDGNSRSISTCSSPFSIHAKGLGNVEVHDLTL